MPRKVPYGERISTVDAGPRKTPANPSAKAASPPIQYDMFCRNGKHPSAPLWNRLNEATNQAILYRTKEFFRAPGWVGAAGGALSGGDRTRYRFAFRTGPHHNSIGFIAAVIPQTAGLTGNAYSGIEIFSDTAEAVSVGECFFHHGVNPGGSLIPSEGLPFIKEIKIGISGLSANTDYYARVDDYDDGRILALTAFELASMTQTTSGYLAQNITAQSEIFDSYRENVATIQKGLLKHGGLSLNYCADVAANANTNNSGTSKNIADILETTVSDATSGFKIDLNNRDRLSQSSNGIPVAMKVFCKTTAVGGNGNIYLRDSSGNAIITITDGIPTTAGGEWISTTGFIPVTGLPVTTDKYDLHFDNNGSGTITVWAVSIYEYEA